MIVAALILAAYMLGSVPSSYLAGRARGVDLREHGSGNLGATNAYRVLGARAAVPVLLTDLAKGFLPVALFPGWDGSGDPSLAIAYGVAAIAGHVWPIWLGFRGGKGVATGAGVLVALAPVTSFVAVLVWIAIVALTRLVSAASIATATVVPLVASLMGAPRSTVIFCAVIAAFVWWTHRGNVQRLVAGTEHRFGTSSGPAGGDVEPGEAP